MRILCLLVLLVIFTALSPSRAATFTLYLAPSESALEVGELPEEDPAIRNAGPLLDKSKAEAGWRWTALTSNWEGYVPSAALSKNFALELGTPIRQSASEQSAVLTVVEQDDQFEILESGDLWTHVGFAKKIAVYFKTSTTLTSNTAVMTPVPSAVPSKRIINPDAKFGNLDPDALPAETVVWSPRPSNSSPSTPAPMQTEKRRPVESTRPFAAGTSGLQPIDIMVPSVQTQAQADEQSIRPQPEAGTPMRRISGKLVRDFNNPAFPLQIQTNQGRRLAYVDMTRLFITNLQPYLGNNVTLHGEVRAVATGSQDVVISARSIRLID